MEGNKNRRYAALYSLIHEYLWSVTNYSHLRSLGTDYAKSTSFLIREQFFSDYQSSHLFHSKLLIKAHFLSIIPTTFFHWQTCSECKVKDSQIPSLFFVEALSIMPCILTSKCRKYPKSPSKINLFGWQISQQLIGI